MWFPEGEAECDWEYRGNARQPKGQRAVLVPRVALPKSSRAHCREELSLVEWLSRSECRNDRIVILHRTKKLVSSVALPVTMVSRSFFNGMLSGERTNPVT